MLLTITTTHRPAADLGYLLHKHPGRFQGYDLSFGKAYVFYPEAGRRPLHRLPAARRGPGGHRPGQGLGGGPAGPVRQRPALRRLVVPQRGDRAGLRLGPPGPLQGPARAGDHPDAALGPDRRAAGAGRRAVPPGGLRAAGLRRRGRPPSARRAIPRVGREPVLLRDHRQGDDPLRPVDAPLRPRAGLRQPEALLRRRGRDGEAAGQGERLAGEPSREGGDHPALPEVPAQPLPPGPGPAGRRRSSRRRPRGTSDPPIGPRTCWRGR